MRLLLAAFLCLLALSVSAHEVRPSYLEITEQRDGTVAIVWKQPSVIANASLTPHLSTGWTDATPATRARLPEAVLQTWQVKPPHAPLAGTAITISGLEQTITDVLVRVTYADGTELTRLLTPTDPRFAIPDGAKVAPPVRDYLLLGFTHIWSGIDHLLYVLGLVLLVRDRKLLVKTITGFTVAHSLTLAAAALGIVHVPPAPVEAVIALSIVYVAVELMHKRQGRAGLAQRAPWLIAISFGLLHGFGFAGALSEVGLPAHAIPQALLLFNVGIEIGQLSFVALVLAAGEVLSFALRTRAAQLEWFPSYAIGSLASFWLIERVYAFL
jgi:hypothetical protein